MFELEGTKAYSNSFFEKSKSKNNYTRIDLVVREWFPITQAFCLSLPSYVALITKEIQENEGERRDALEQASLVPIAIGAGEFGFGTRGLNSIHYRMFARLGEPLGLNLNDLRQTPRGTLVETGLLVDAINETLSDLYFGAGCIRVVEGIAYNIVDAMNHLFRPMMRSNSEPLFTEHQLEYITLHLRLERDHDYMAGTFIETLGDTPEHQASIAAGVEKISHLFGNYWEALARVVFVESPSEAIFQC
ncbi:MAG: hypothetical protein QOH63_1606 [Acidobacteriota bacterium]|jgi:hypothetical protein|nr:hypothetical protein [Acidobacteriota bacterium]